MTVRTVVLPGSPLLVPGAAGRATVLREAREAALAALRDLLSGADDVVVVAAGDEDAHGPARASLAAVGVADAWIDPVWRRATRHEVPRTAGPGASVALLALAGAGWTGPVEVVELAAGSTAAGCRALGEELRRRAARVVAVEDPRSPFVPALLDGFVDPAWDAVAATSPGESEERTYEVRRHVHRTSSPESSRAVGG